MPSFHSNGKTEFELATDEDSWIISKSIIILQNDGYNFGPIACLVLGSIFEPKNVNRSAIYPHNYLSFLVTMFNERVDQINSELILPSELHDTVSTQQVGMNRYARHAVERAIKETPIK